jgi:hypothetical protein
MAKDTARVCNACADRPRVGTPPRPTAVNRLLEEVSMGMGFGLPKDPGEDIAVVWY